MSASRRRFLAAGICAAAPLALPMPPLRAQRARLTEDPFTLGVASGFPEPNAVTLWTRLAPQPLVPGGGMPPAAVAVDWAVADDERFARIVRSGTSWASPDLAHSVHVDVAGLEPARTYWYRFTCDGIASPTGRTRTAPALASPRLRLAVACCQHYESGYYAGYRSIADAAPDLVVHLGDYIYEDRGVRATANRVPPRSHDLAEAFTLDDYRMRYALYKLDPDLRRAHAELPWIVTWDDHEVDNDYAAAISMDADPEAHFLERRAAAYRAYYEHLPLPRSRVPLGAHLRLRTRLGWGGLVEIALLDGRQYRSDQVCGGRLVEPCPALFAESRTMLGRAQEQWLARTLKASAATWQVLAQQTVFAHMDQAPGAAVGYWADGWSGYPVARRRAVDLLTTHRIRNPVILSGDVHGFLVNDVHARPGDPSSHVAAAEIVTTSISSNGPPQQVFDDWRDDNANVRFARSDKRGYTLLDVTAESLRADLIAVDDASRADSGTSVLATFEIEDGRAGVAR